MKALNLLKWDDDEVCRKEHVKHYTTLVFPVTSHKLNIQELPCTVFVLVVPFPFLFVSHSLCVFSFSCRFSFTSFHYLSMFRQSYPWFTFILCVFSSFPYCFFRVLLMFLWFPFPFVSFSFSAPFDVPFMALSCHFSFLPFGSCKFPCMSCHFVRSYRISAHVRVIFFS